MASMRFADPQTARDYADPYSIQFSVFLANRVGQLKDTLDLFAEQEVDVYGLSIVDSTDWAVIRTIFSDPDKAREVLRRREIPFTESQVLLVELEDRRALVRICGLLLQTEINVHFAYPLAIRCHENAVMVFHVDDLVLARQVLTRHGFTLPGWEDLADPGD